MGKLSIMIDLRFEEGHPNRYRLQEVYPCVDGYRSRLTNRSFPSLEAAKKFIEQETAS